MEIKGKDIKLAPLQKESSNNLHSRNEPSIINPKSNFSSSNILSKGDTHALNKKVVDKATRKNNVYHFKNKTEESPQDKGYDLNESIEEVKEEKDKKKEKEKEINLRNMNERNSSGDKTHIKHSSSPDKSEKREYRNPPDNK